MVTCTSLTLKRTVLLVEAAFIDVGGYLCCRLRRLDCAPLSVRGRERQDKELLALRQRLVDQQSKHALETDRLRRQLSEARARLQQLEVGMDGEERGEQEGAATGSDLEGELLAVDAQCSSLAARLAEAEHGSAAMRLELEAARRRSVFCYWSLCAVCCMCVSISRVCVFHPFLDAHRPAPSG